VLISAARRSHECSSRNRAGRDLPHRVPEGSNPKPGRISTAQEGAEPSPAESSPLTPWVDENGELGSVVVWLAVPGAPLRAAPQKGETHDALSTESGDEPLCKTSSAPGCARPNASGACRMVRFEPRRAGRLPASQHPAQREWLRGSDRGPWARAQAISIHSQGQTLTISGKRSNDAAPGTVHRNERWSGEFKRSLALLKDMKPTRATLSQPKPPTRLGLSRT